MHMVKSWLDSLESCMTCSVDHIYGIPDIELELSTCKASALKALLSHWHDDTKFLLNTQFIELISPYNNIFY